MLLSGTAGQITGARLGRHRWLILLLWLCPVLAMAQSVSLTIEGINGDLARNVERHVTQLDLTDRESVRRQRALVLRSARRALEALGYYDSVIQLDLSPPERKRVELKLTIQRGEPVRWRNTTVKFIGPGSEDPLLTDVVRQHAPQKNKVLNHEQYENLKKELRTRALSYGYFDASLSRHKLLIDRTERAADLDLEFVTGERYRFGEVHFTESALSDKSLQRLIPFRQGDYYDEAKVTEFNRNLLDSGYFRSVGLFPRHERAEDASDAVVPIDVELDDNAFNRVSVGLGYGTDTGPRVRLSWLMPRLNRRGHSLQFATSVSEPRQEFTSEYKIPDGKPGTDFWLLQAGYLEETFEDNQYRQVSAGISRQQQVWGDWIRTLSVKLKREVGQIEGSEVSASVPDDAFYITPGIGISRVVQDHQVRPRKGYRLSLDMEFSDPSLGSDTEYVRIMGLAKWLLPFSERQQLLLRLQVGALWSQDFERVPVSARFFAGGDQSIRGYDYNSLGPRDADDALIGGSRLLVSSVEYLYQFRPNWKAALFVDHGGAMDETTESTDTGAGFGVRWMSPLGMISLDLANAVSADERWSVHVTMGAAL